MKLIVHGESDEDEGSVTSEATKSSVSHTPSATDEDDSENESDDWILDEIHRQIDDQLQADIDRQLEEQLWKEMDEQLEKQMDDQVQRELNQQLNDMILLSTPQDHLNNKDDDCSSKIEGNGEFQLLQSASTRTPIESANNNVQQEASVSSINDQIQKIALQYENLNLKSIT